MRHRLCFGLVLLICGDVLSAAQSGADASDAHKSAPQAPSSVTESELLPKDCRKTDPPLCDTPPRVVFQPETPFLPKPGKNTKGGFCVLSATVEPDGRTSHIRVMKSIDWDLDQDAIHAVKQWKFKPLTLRGKPVAAQIVVEVDFH